MARYKGNAQIGQTYDPTYYAPLDTRQLVYTYSELFIESNWIPAGKTSMNDSNVYNGMIVSVGSDPDTTKNGLYRLFDPDNPGKDDIPDVTKDLSWHKLVEFSELTAYLNSLGGYLLVDTLEERDRLNLDSLREGTEVYVVSLDVSYRLRNRAWVQLSTSSGSNEIATSQKAGIVMVGTGLKIDAEGRLSIDVVGSVIRGETKAVSSGAVYDYIEEKIGDIDSVLSKI